MKTLPGPRDTDPNKGCITCLSICLGVPIVAAIIVVLLVLHQITYYGPDLKSPDGRFVARVRVIYDSATVNIWENHWWRGLFSRDTVYTGIGSYTPTGDCYPRIRWRDQHTLSIDVCSTPRTQCFRSTLGVNVVCDGKPPLPLTSCAEFRSSIEEAHRKMQPKPKPRAPAPSPRQNIVRPFAPGVAWKRLRDGSYVKYDPNHPGETEGER